MTTFIHNANHIVISSAPLGTIVHDKVVVTGSTGIPTGTVIFNLYKNPNCKGIPVSSTVALVGGTAESPDTILPNTGLSYLVHYNGDTVYLPVDGICERLYLTTTILSGSKSDGWVLESGENTNIGGSLNSTSTTLRLGDDASRKQYRSILSFSTGPGLPDTAIVTKVTLKVRQSGIIGGGNPVTILLGFMADIKKGFLGTPALQTSDFQTPASGTYGPFLTAPSGGWYNINLTAGKLHINKLAVLSGLTQIRLRFKLDDNNNAIANYLSLFSGNAPLASRPQLIIEYYVP